MKFVFTGAADTGFCKIAAAVACYPARHSSSIQTLSNGEMVLTIIFPELKQRGARGAQRALLKQYPGLQRFSKNGSPEVANRCSRRVTPLEHIRHSGFPEVKLPDDVEATDNRRPIYVTTLPVTYMFHQKASRSPS